jgi:hypothetical protein
VVEPRVITIGHKLGKEEALRRVEPALSRLLSSILVTDSV